MNNKKENPRDTAWMCDNCDHIATNLYDLVGGFAAFCDEHDFNIKALHDAGIVFTSEKQTVIELSRTTSMSEQEKSNNECHCVPVDDGSHEGYCSAFDDNLCSNYKCTPEDCTHICACHECFCARCKFLMCPHHEETCNLYIEEEVVEIKGPIFMGRGSRGSVDRDDKYKDIKFVYRPPTRTT